MEYLTDPSINISNELENIKALTPENVLEYAEDITTGWITDTIDRYADDYQVLQENWADICRRISFISGRLCLPQKLILVRDVFFNETEPARVLLQKLCDKLTEFGYCIRRDSELLRCRVTGNAILSEELHAKILESRSPFALNLPQVWSDTSSGEMPE